MTTWSLICSWKCSIAADWCKDMNEMHRMWLNVISPQMAWGRYSVSWIIFFPFPQTRTCTWLKTLITMLEEPEIHRCTNWNSAQNASEYMYCMWVQKPCKYDAGTLKILPETRIFGWVEGWKKNLTGHMRKTANSHSHRSKELLSLTLSLIKIL